MCINHLLIARRLLVMMAMLTLGSARVLGELQGGGGHVARASDDPPILVTQPQSAAGLEGDSIVLSVAAGGTPPLQFQWFKDGELIPWAVTSVFEIPSLLEADAGLYRVEVSNAFGKVLSANASVTFVPLIQIHVDGVFTSGIARVSTPVTVSLKAARPGWILHYTTDGSEPLPSSPIYAAPFVVSQNLELRVAADSPDHQEFLEGDSLRFLFLAPQVVTWGDLPKLRYPESGPVSATASSGLPVRIRVLSGPAVVEGSLLRATGSGSVTLRAEQEGNETFAAAISDQTFEIGRGLQTVTFQSIADRFVDDPPVQLVASATTGLPVVFQLVSGPAQLVGSLLTPTGAGRIEVKALQQGSDLWLPAETVQSFVVKESAGPAIIGIAGPNQDGSLLLSIRAATGQTGNLQFSTDLIGWTPIAEVTGAGFQQPVNVLIPPGSTASPPAGFWRFVSLEPKP